MLSRLVTRCCRWYLSFSLPSVELWSCSSCTYFGSSLISAEVCAETGGMAAAMNPPTNANSARMTISTAAQRRMPMAVEPDHDRVEARRDEEREPDQDQHRAWP